MMILIHLLTSDFMQADAADRMPPTFDQMTPGQLHAHAAWAAEYRGLKGLDEAIKTFDNITPYLPEGETILSPEDRAFLEAARRVLTNVQNRFRDADLPSVGADAAH